MTASPHDLAVIGSGTAAMVAATRVQKAGWRVAIIDFRPYGGTCALRGCDPKKMLTAGRSGGNYRVYGNKELRRLSFVRRARDLGFSLDQVHDRSRSCGAVDKLARENLTAFEREIADLSARFAVSWGACSTNVAKARSPITASLMPSPQD